MTVIILTLITLTLSMMTISFKIYETTHSAKWQSVVITPSVTNKRFTSLSYERRNTQLNDSQQNDI